MTLLERMARAIAQIDHNGRIAGEGYWRDPDTGSGHHIEQARAALMMMLEPSEAMIDAVWDRTHPACGDPLPQPDEKPGEGWVPGALRAAIQAALDEKEG